MRILHAADLHLDSAFAGLAEEKAALLRQESRDILRRMVDWANDHAVDVMLLSGDLFDSDRMYSQTARPWPASGAGYFSPPATTIFTLPAAAMTQWTGRRMCIFSPPAVRKRCSCGR